MMVCNNNENVGCFYADKIEIRFAAFTGIPQPIDLQGFPTNTSVTLQWRLPGNVQQDDLYFNVSYMDC